jgi:hypothetical protein
MPASQLIPPSGSASISGIAVLENPRQQNESPRTLLFDAHVFCPVNALEGDSEDPNDEDKNKNSRKPGILASLRYFNSQDLSFDNVDAYFITANVRFKFFINFSKM